MSEINDRLLGELVEAVKALVRKEQSDRLRDIYLIGDIEKDVAKTVIERLRELANESPRPITLYINSAGGNVTDGLAIHDAIRHTKSSLSSRGWPTRWARSSCKRQVRGAGSRFLTPGS
jgi:ATP-dependent protease ClpP protease subunit